MSRSMSCKSAHNRRLWTTQSTQNLKWFAMTVQCWRWCTKLVGNCSDWSTCETKKWATLYTAEYCLTMMQQIRNSKCIEFNVAISNLLWNAHKWRESTDKEHKWEMLTSDWHQWFCLPSCQTSQFLRSAISTAWMLTNSESTSTANSSNTR